MTPHKHDNVWWCGMMSFLQGKFDLEDLLLAAAGALILFLLSGALTDFSAWKQSVSNKLDNIANRQVTVLTDLATIKQKVDDHLININDKNGGKK